jgi:hypothetical protein
MNAPAPPKRENRARAGRGFPKLQQWITYLVIRLSQIGTPRIRRCVCCNTHITNINLGGNNGRSPLTGDLYCLGCADFPTQQLLRLRGKR